MLTELGKALRKLRIDHDERLLDMGERLGKTPAFISAVETGKKSPPTDLIERIIAAYALNLDNASRFRKLADMARRSFTLRPQSEAGQELAGLLARKINSLPDEALLEIRMLLKKREGTDEQH